MLVIKAHSKRINDLAFSPDGKLLASAGIDGTVRVTDTHTGGVSVLIPAPKDQQLHWERVAFCGDGDQVLCRSWNGLQAWSVSKAKCVAKLMSYADVSYQGGIAVSPTNHLAVANEWGPLSGQYPWVVRRWDTRTWEEHLPIGSGQSISAGLAFDPTGTRLATSIGLFDATTGRRLLFAYIPGDRLKWSPTAPVVAGTMYSNFLIITGTETGQQVAQLSLARKYVQDCAFSPDGRFLAVVSNEAAVRVWDTQTWEEQREFAWGIGKLKCIAFAPDGLRAACGSESGRILIWDWDL